MRKSTTNVVHQQARAETAKLMESFDRWMGPDPEQSRREVL